MKNSLLDKFTQQRNSLSFIKDKPKRPASKTSDLKTTRDIVEFFKMKQQKPSD